MQCQEVSPNYFTLRFDAPEAQKIASGLKWYSPRFSPKNVPRFYDISTVTEHPELFALVVQILVDRYKRMDAAHAPTHILAFDARGFLLGAPVALGLGVPCVLLRKQEKSPGVLVKSEEYQKEYAEAHADTMVIRLGSVNPGARVVLIDDLIATGGTAISGFQLVEGLGATVVEFTAIVGIPFLDGVSKIHTYNNCKYKDVPVFTLIHDTQVPDSCCGDPKDWPADRPRVLGYKEAVAMLR